MRLSVTFYVYYTTFSHLAFVCAWWIRMINITSFYQVLEYCNYVVWRLWHESVILFRFRTYCGQYAYFWFN